MKLIIRLVLVMAMVPLSCKANSAFAANEPMIVGFRYDCADNSFHVAVEVPPSEDSGTVNLVVAINFDGAMHFQQGYAPSKYGYVIEVTVNPPNLKRGESYVFQTWLENHGGVHEYTGTAACQLYLPVLRGR